MGTMESFAGRCNVEFQIFKRLATCDVQRRVDKEEICKSVFLVLQMFHIFRIFVRNCEGYNFSQYSGEKTVKLHMSPVFPSRIK
jgi:hypothetical protein